MVYLLQYSKIYFIKRLNVNIYFDIIIFSIILHQKLKESKP